MIPECLIPNRIIYIYLKGKENSFIRGVIKTHSEEGIILSNAAIIDGSVKKKFIDAQCVPFESIDKFYVILSNEEIRKNDTVDLKDPVDRFNYFMQNMDFIIQNFIGAHF